MWTQAFAIFTTWSGTYHSEFKANDDEFFLRKVHDFVLEKGISSIQGIHH